MNQMEKFVEKFNEKKERIKKLAQECLKKWNKDSDVTVGTPCAFCDDAGFTSRDIKDSCNICLCPDVLCDLLGKRENDSLFNIIVDYDIDKYSEEELQVRDIYDFESVQLMGQAMQRLAQYGDLGDLEEMIENHIDRAIDGNICTPEEIENFVNDNVYADITAQTDAIYEQGTLTFSTENADFEASFYCEKCFTKALCAEDMIEHVKKHLLELRYIWVK